MTPPPVAKVALLTIRKGMTLFASAGQSLCGLLVYRAGRSLIYI
jgi:hypothetical protein